MKETFPLNNNGSIITQNLQNGLQTIKELPNRIHTKILETGAAIRERRFTECDDASIQESFVIFDRICEDMAYGTLTPEDIPQILAELRERDIQLEFLVGISLKYGSWILDYPISLNTGRQEGLLSEPQKLSQCCLPVFGQSL